MIRTWKLLLVVPLAVALAACGGETATKLGVCGDGVVRGTEECDDGNTEEGDGCSATCLFEGVCGDGVKQTGEECDKGAENSDLGICTRACKTARCGDALVQEGVEQCDDGNIVNTDGCNNACRFSVSTRCGDGVKGDNEECDDGNNVDTDACSNSCRLPFCGDGVKNGTEECDDANDNDADACTNACTNAICGDGIVRPSHEQCDDGNQDDEDGCLNVCTNARCGDGAVHTGVEECDDGNTDDDDACSNACIVLIPVTCGNGVTEGIEQCDDGNQDETDGCLSTCRAARCGDGQTQVGVEDCDDRNSDETDACRNDCTAARCGDGVVRTGVEACDDGNTEDADGCTNACTLPRCGDGIRQSNEQCDDGNMNLGDGCDTFCQREFLEEEEPKNDSNNVATNTQAIVMDGGSVVRIRGSISRAETSAGLNDHDRDFFKVSVAQPTVFLWDSFDDTGAGCAGGITPTVGLFPASGAGVSAALGSSEANTGIATCEQLTMEAPAGDSFIRIEERGRDSTMSYSLVATPVPSLGAEVEPNNTAAAATAFTAAPGHMSGGITATDTQDWFKITVPQGGSIRAEVIDSGTFTCGGTGGMDTVLTLYAPDGTTIITTDDEDGRGSCSMINGHDPSPPPATTDPTDDDSLARNLNAGTYYLKVTPFLPLAVFNYRLVVHVK